MAKSKFHEALQSKKFVITAEIGPPKGIDIDEMKHHIDLLKDKVDGLNVTDNQSSVMRIGSLPVCKLIKEAGGEPILQMTCRDRNRLALQSELLGAYILGIRNVLCLTGDYITVGDHIEAKPVFDLDSVLLLKAVSELEQGKDFAGNELKGAPSFCKGAIVTPEANPLEPQLIKFEKKIEAGAEFIQTQAIYEPAKFEKFMKEAEKFKVPVLAGIVIVKSAGMAKYMNANVAGVFVPESIIKPLAEASKEDRPKVAIDLMANLMKELKPMCQGFHIMAMGWEKYVPELLEKAGLT